VPKENALLALVFFFFLPVELIFVIQAYPRCLLKKIGEKQVVLQIWKYTLNVYRRLSPWLCCFSSFSNL
jgi:hypothetical protein